MATGSFLLVLLIVLAINVLLTALAVKLGISWSVKDIAKAHQLGAESIRPRIVPGELAVNVGSTPVGYGENLRYQK